MKFGKRIAWTFFLGAILLAGCGKKDKPPEIVLPPLSHAEVNLDTLVQKFMRAIESQDTATAAQLLVQFSEYQNMYPYMADADSTPGSDKFVANMLTLSNKKELKRWLGRAKEDSIQFVRHQITGEKESHSGHALIRGVKIFVRNRQGQVVEFPIFRTIIEVNGGYKIWTLLEV